MPEPFSHPLPVEPESRAEDRILAGSAVIAGLAALWIGLGNLPASVELAYVPLRTAWNLVHGEGLVYNPGERVEGFPSPLWTLMLAVPLRLDWDGLLAAKVLGLVFTALAASGAVLLAGELVGPRGRRAALATALGASLVAVSHPAAWWATGGLEAPLLAAALVWALYRLAFEARLPGARPWSAALAGLAALSGPGATLLVAVLAAARALQARRSQDWSGLSRWLALAGAPLVAWLLFRLSYYPDLLPSALYQGGRGASSGRGLHYIWEWIRLEPLYALAGGVGLGLLLRRRAALGLAVAGLVGAQLLLVLWARGDAMPSFRLLVPVLPVLAAAAGAGFGLLARRPWVLGLAITTLVLQAVLSLPVAKVVLNKGPEDETEIKRREADDWAPATLSRPPEAGSQALTAWLLERVPPNARLATAEIGLPAYAGGWPILDLGGLVSPALSDAAGLSLEERVEHVRAWEPDWILLRASDSDPYRSLREARWLKRYTLSDGPQPGLVVARRKGASEATPDEALSNFEQAASRTPRLRLLIKRWVALARKEGDAARRRAACEHTERYAPDELEILDRCREPAEPDRKAPRARERARDHDNRDQRQESRRDRGGR